MKDKEIQNNVFLASTLFPRKCIFSFGMLFDKLVEKHPNFFGCKSSRKINKVRLSLSELNRTCYLWEDETNYEVTDQGWEHYKSICNGGKGCEVWSSDVEAAIYGRIIRLQAYKKWSTGEKKQINIVDSLTYWEEMNLHFQPANIEEITQQLRLAIEEVSDATLIWKGRIVLGNDMRLLLYFHNYMLDHFLHHWYVYERNLPNEKQRQNNKRSKNRCKKVGRNAV